MDKKNKSDMTELIEQKEILCQKMPDKERRKILKKLATCAFVAPAAMVLLEGGDTLTYAGRSGGGDSDLHTRTSYRPVDKNS